MSISLNLRPSKTLCSIFELIIPVSLLNTIPCHYFTFIYFLLSVYLMLTEIS